MSAPFHMRETEGKVDVSPDDEDEIELGTISTFPGISSDFVLSPRLSSLSMFLQITPRILPVERVLHPLRA